MRMDSDTKHDILLEYLVEHYQAEDNFYEHVQEYMDENFSYGQSGDFLALDTVEVETLKIDPTTFDHRFPAATEVLTDEGSEWVEQRDPIRLFPHDRIFRARE